MKYDAHQCLAARLRSLSRIADGIYRRHLAGSGTTEQQLNILLILYQEGEVPQKRVSEVLELERSSLTRNLVRLVNQGWIEKKGPVNRPQISLTAKGKKATKKLLPHWEAAMDELSAALGGEGMLYLNMVEKKLR
ncbi:MAG: MarR family transcriptional regulator [Bacteroidota bacterium]